jgi:hypothetical protein
MSSSERTDGLETAVAEVLDRPLRTLSGGGTGASRGWR